MKAQNSGVNIFCLIYALFVECITVSAVAEANIAVCMTWCKGNIWNVKDLKSIISENNSSSNDIE